MTDSLPRSEQPFEDLLGDTSGDYGSEHFSPSEFALREALEDHHYWHLHRRQVIFEELLRAGVSRQARLIELGCGIGTVATYLNSRGFAVDYSDIHREALVIARRRAQSTLGTAAESRRFVRFDVTRAALEPAYEGILMLDVLEHLPDDRNALVNATQGLPRGGVAMFTVPAFQLLWSPWDDMEHHKRRYTVAQARKLAENAGLVVQRATCFFFPLFFAALGVKLLRKARQAAVGPAPVAANILEMAETKTNPTLNGVARKVLAAEHPVRRSLGFALGTSVMCVARKP